MEPNALEIIQLVLAGGLLGLLGQGIRMTIGLKKHSDANIQAAQATPIDTSRLVLSLFIGFIAGALYVLIKQDPDFGNSEFIFTVIAAGYSGADFIEGFFNTYVNKLPGTQPAPAETSPSPSPNAGDTANQPAAVSAADRRDDDSNNL